MRYFKINRMTLGGRCNKIFKKDQIVMESQLHRENIDKLIQDNSISLVNSDGEAINSQEEIDVIRIPEAPQFVDSFNIEFGYELLSVLPFANFLHENGKLTGTRSGIDTKCFYFFSKNHQENPQERNWNNMKQAWRAKLPNIGIHSPNLNLSQFSPPNFKDKYANERFKFDKPIVCICNRINIEWGREIINYFDLECLSRMFSNLSEKYQVIYFNIAGKPEYYDGVDPVNIGDYDLARESGAIVIHDLHEQNQDLSFNALQLMVMANCQAFITMNGGYSILASYFGGTNVIYTKECREIGPDVNSFYRWYHKLGGSRIIHCENYEDLHMKIDTVFMEQKPLVNILVRTNNRPNFFDKCYQSILSQTYENVNIIVGYHSGSAQDYLIPYKIKPVKYPKYDQRIPIHENKDDYGRPFPSNFYLNVLRDQVQEGLVILLDDDDCFESPTAIEEIVSAMKSEDDLVLWRIFAMGKKIPSDQNFRSNPIAKDISGISFCCHSKHFKQETFEPYRLMDFRLIRNLYEKLNPVYIDKFLTGMQSGGCNMGRGNDI